MSDWLDAPGDFFPRLVRYADKGNFNPFDMLKLIGGESDFYAWAGKPSPLRPLGSNYQGLTQIGKSELKHLGWKEAVHGPFWKMSAAEQLLYTARYYAGKNVARWESAGHLLAANLAPGHLTRADRVVYTRKDHLKPYMANEKVDMNKDGVIDWDDCTLYLEWVIEKRCPKRYARACALLEAEMTSPLDAA